MAGFDPFWMNRLLVRVVFDYVFRQLKCENLFAEVRSSNQRVISISEKIGFVKDVVIKDVFPEDDLVVFRMRAENCKWITSKGNP